MVLNTKTGGVKPPVFKKGEKMKYLILRDTVADGVIVKAGDVVDLAEDVGNILIQYKKAEIAKDKPKKEESNRSVGLEKSKKEVKKRSK
ncbi:MAG: hypothetical protein Tp1100SUR763771_15 [Prokaryotic dsDNA virus sp.]|jgi:hypothetical protein|nr:MAG: hypothetical protein Tp1100SUR763771_15 [Prokaryotic dsDNA virus sp.]|tara:strand:+ start:296 stop:562 length:267 start_codon:yes stop_codon:yes gene_type:complete